MDNLGRDISELCKDFIKIVNKLYENGQITYEQYVDMTKLKLEYMEKNRVDL